MGNFWTVVKAVYKKNVRSAAWLILLLSPVIFILIVGGILKLVDNTTSQSQIAIVADKSTTTYITNSLPSYVKYSEKNRKDALSALSARKVDGILIIDRKPFSAKYEKLGSTSNILYQQEIEEAVRQTRLQLVLNGLNVSTNKTATLQTPYHLKINNVYNDGTKKNVNKFILLVILLMIAIITVYGTLIAQEIASEKDTRIMEVLLSSVSARTQFYAKLTSTLFLLLTQIIVYTGVGVLTWRLIKNQILVKKMLALVNLKGVPLSVILLLIVFFIGNLILYSELAAVCGSLVSNKEQINSATMPISMLSFVAYILAQSSITSSTQAHNILSYIPFLNVGLLPIRYSAGQVGLPAVVVSSLILIISIVLFTWFSSKMYRSNVLAYSRKGIVENIRFSIKA